MVKLLIVKPSSLGDVIHTLPALSLLRQRLGSRLERVSWVVNTSFRGLLELSPDVDRIISFPRERIWHWSAVKPFLQELRAEEYDVCIDFQGLLRSGLIAKASGAPRRIGFATGRECSPMFYTERYRPTERHAVEKNLGLAAFSFPDGCGAYEQRGALLRIPDEQRSCAEALLGKAGERPILAVGHSSRWNSKNWPVSFFSDVLDGVAKALPETLIWLLGTGGEREHAEQVVSRCRVARPLNLSGKSNMMGLVAMIGQSQAMLTNDSGPMHLAAALDVPVVALFGATDPTLTGPYGAAGRHAVFCSKCEHSPCFKKDCPLGTDRCSEGTAVGDVVEALVRKLVERRKQETRQ